MIWGVAWVMQHEKLAPLLKGATSKQLFCYDIIIKYKYAYACVNEVITLNSGISMWQPCNSSACEGVSTWRMVFYLHGKTLCPFFRCRVRGEEGVGCGRVFKLQQR